MLHLDIYLGEHERKGNMKVIQIDRLHTSFCQGDDNASDWNQLSTECPKKGLLKTNAGKK